MEFVLGKEVIVCHFLFVFVGLGRHNNLKRFTLDNKKVICYYFLQKVIYYPGRTLWIFRK